MPHIIANTTYAQVGNEAPVGPSPAAKLNRTDSFKATGRYLLAGLLCGAPERSATLVRSASLCGSHNLSVNAQLGNGSLPIPPGRVKKAILSTLEGTSGRMMLDLCGASKKFRKHAGPNGNWGRLPCGFWAAIQARVSHPQRQYQYGNPVRNTVSDLLHTFDANQASIEKYYKGVDEGLKEWLEQNGLEIWCQLPQESSSVQVKASKSTVVAALMAELFVSEVKGYRLITFHSSTLPGTKAHPGQHTIAVSPGQPPHELSVSLFDPAFGEIRFAERGEFIRWFEEQFWPLSGYQERFQNAFDVSFVRWR